MNKHSQPAPRLQKIIGYLIAFAVIVATLGYYFYQALFAANIQFEKEGRFLYVPTGAGFEQVKDSLEQNDMLHDKLSFMFLSKLTGYRNEVRPGAFFVKTNTSNFELIRALKGGRQTPVKITFNNRRTLGDLCAYLSTQMEADSLALANACLDTAFLQSVGMDSAKVIALFIPDTYEVYWNITPKDFLKKMSDAYRNFWDSARLTKAQSLKLDPTEAVTLASIVYQETNRPDEYADIAGVYINRLNKNMALQADPTVKFALGDFSLKRIYSKHTAVESPYNTYKVKGLPPGPICMPSIEALDKTLSANNHNYLYFCAKADLSGKHAFSKNFENHQKNARAYWRALNKAGIE